MSIIARKFLKCYSVFSVIWTIFSLTILLIALLRGIFGTNLDESSVNKFQSSSSEYPVESFIQSHNGAYTLTGSRGDRHIDSVCFENSDIDDEGITRLKTLPEIHRIELKNTKVTQNGLEEVKQIPSIREILYDDQIYFSSEPQKSNISSSQPKENQGQNEVKTQIP